MDNEFLRQLIERYERATFVVNRRLNAMIKERMEEELTLDQYSTIRYIRGRGSCTSSELADSFCVGKSSITAIVNRLADKDLIRRLPDEKDRRVTYLTLTEEGERLAQAGEEKIQELLSGYLQHFDEEEARQFIQTYEKLARVLLSDS
ncbi:MarR family transcriptional regulator [Paenibacillus aurantius]|uniref:MarR family transcriptional regulator n=1 Tax=Paenibacillus aurantius TaxID=2918900 RepID=A0AA96LDR5_9BACL|nr:MarR family transcriptional regulator [Paenibacillus aurantius]WNQ11363.1 MarR family transcriptional regulator [Paenibacillus aurantius]